MGDARNDPNLFLVDPDMRGIIPLGDFHVPKRLLRKVKQDPFRVTIDQAFTRVMELCAESAKGRESTWINSPILNLYSSLHREGHAHSIECWQDGELAGGLYGVSFERVFCGESMFSRTADASKVALAWLVAAMRQAGFALLDCQFMTDHLRTMGAIEIRQRDYLQLLGAAVGSLSLGAGSDVKSTASRSSAGWKTSTPSSPTSSKPNRTG